MYIEFIYQNINECNMTSIEIIQDIFNVVIEADKQ